MRRNWCNQNHNISQTIQAGNYLSNIRYKYQANIRCAAFSPKVANELLKLTGHTKDILHVRKLT